ncbi:MAG: hypothetical protein ABJC13_12475 [Acidobacteriota bacterium]
MRRFLLLFVLPAMLVLGAIALPLARGERTFFLRDVLNSHLNMKWAQAEALRAGYLPLVDLYRAGGQPLAGNPNAVPFYPDNVLYLIASPLWAMNAHFWIHLLLAPFAFYWMARAFGLRREASWAAALAYTFSGFFFSHLNFFNLIAGATLAPAFVAACLRLGLPERRSVRMWMPAALALLWALLLLGGDPFLAALALALGGTAFLMRNPRPSFALWGLLAGALTLGSVLALPQIVEFLRILPLSFRGHYGYAANVATTASWDPRQIIEWFVPFFFGRPDRLTAGGFWGHRFFTDVPPYYFSLYPGLLVLALAASSGKPRSRAAIWGWGAVGLGIFFALGRFNPGVEWVFALGRGSFRYPVKFWPPVAIGLALLAGLGFERRFAPSAPGGPATATEEASATPPRGLSIALWVLFIGLLCGWIFESFFPAAALAGAKELLPIRLASLAANERVRWAGLCLFSLLAVALFGMATWLSRRHLALGSALLLALHVAFQLFFLGPLYATDEVGPYLETPAALAYIPPGSRVVHGSFLNLMRQAHIERGDYPQPLTLYMERRAFAELYPFTGPMNHRRFELNVSPEGLDSFLTRMSQGGIKTAKDIDRVRLLAAWGVNRLLLGEPLAADAEKQAQLLAKLPSFGHDLLIYEIPNAAPAAYLATRLVTAPHMNAGYAALLAPGFDPRTEAVVEGEKGSERREGGTVRILEDGSERFVADVDSHGPGFLVVQRADLSIYQAKIDGHPAERRIANLHRIGIPVPAGRHRVEIATDRRPLHRSLAAAFAAFLMLPLLGWVGGRVRMPLLPDEPVEETAAEEPQLEGLAPAEEPSVLIENLEIEESS